VSHGERRVSSRPPRRAGFKAACWSIMISRGLNERHCTFLALLCLHCSAGRPPARSHLLFATTERLTRLLDPLYAIDSLQRSALTDRYAQ